MKLWKCLFQNKKSVEEINADAKKELEQLIKKDKEESEAMAHDFKINKDLYALRDYKNAKKRKGP